MYIIYMHVRGGSSSSSAVGLGSRSLPFVSASTNIVVRRDDRLVVIVVIIMPEEAVGLSQEDENRKYVASVSLYLSGNAIHA